MIQNKDVFPFSAIIGQENMKKALILNILNPTIGGVLIRGEKGTAKSTTVRALAQLLPNRSVIDGCRCNCSAENSQLLCPECKALNYDQNNAPMKQQAMEVVELPLNATEDRVAGTIDIEHALSQGKQRFEPGILARAHGNILYVDEVNLLEDHVVDMLLDAAAMGVNYVEREGISFSHASRFVLVGTMNPEEGDIRPQLLDRFGIVVDVTAEEDIERRMTIVSRRIAFDSDCQTFCEKWKEQNNQLRESIHTSKQKLRTVDIGQDLVKLTAEICIETGVDGHRADITIIKTACALAALNNCHEVCREHILEAAAFALPHRTRRKPFEESSFSKSFLEKWQQ